MKKVLTSLFAVILVLTVSPLAKANASNQLDKQHAFNLLKKSFELQVSLSEQPRSMNDIRNLLKEAFTKEFAEDFIHLNVQSSLDGKGYQTYGTDMALYYIPFFTYGEETEFGYSSVNDHWYVYEWFPDNADGPVSYEGHYEAIGLIYENNRWVINDYQLTFDPEVIDSGKDSEKEMTVKSNKHKQVDEQTMLDKLTTFISYGFINQMSHWFGFDGLK